MSLEGEKMGYPSDLKDKEWDLIKEHFKIGNRSIHEKRVLINAVLYLVRTGCQWRWFPKDFPNWKTVYTFYRRMCQQGIWDKLLQDVVIRSRSQSGRDWDPSAFIIDSQSVKTTNASHERGVDGGKKNQRKKATCSD
jgi:transposase